MAAVALTNFAKASIPTPISLIVAQCDSLKLTGRQPDSLVDISVGKSRRAREQLQHSIRRHTRTIDYPIALVSTMR
ncbi:MAG: hypothetical protein ABI442_02325 [Gemmatimonadaceae bacterium]